MVMTILEARVPKGNWNSLKEAYEKQLRSLPSSIVHTYLIQSSSDNDIFRIVTVWRSREELDKMRSQGTPAGVIMFRSVGAEPSLSIFDVTAEAH
jgi:hypothetical protein